jgi:hypothetical protein
MSAPDTALLQVLRTGRKFSKESADYSVSESAAKSCVKCKFNLGDEEKCHVVQGRVDNDRGISKFFSPRGDGMLPGDIVWHHVKKTGGKLDWDEGYVIKEGAEGFQCRDCKFYLYSRGCLIVKGTFRPEMSCGFVVKTNHGTEL